MGCTRIVSLIVNLLYNLLRIPSRIYNGNNGKLLPVAQSHQKSLWYRAFLTSKCVGTNVIITAGASRNLLAPAWLPRNKGEGSFQGRGAFIATLDGFLCLCYFLTTMASTNFACKRCFMYSSMPMCGKPSLS